MTPPSTRFPTPGGWRSGRPSGTTCPIVRWLPTYDRGQLRFDAIAGIVAWGVMVPVAMAYAGLAGMPPETGLVTAFAALTAYAVFGTSREMKVTASSSVAIMSASVVGAVAAGDASLFVALSAALALIVGAILIVAGLARLGFLSQFLAASVVTGFVIGLAVVITIGQIPALLGIPGGGSTIIDKVATIAAGLDDVNRYTAALGVGNGRRHPRPEAGRPADPGCPRGARRRDRAIGRCSTSLPSALPSSVT